MRVDWSSFLSQHDLVYERTGKIWQDALPLGNGTLGALAYAPLHPEFLINKNDVYDYRHGRKQDLPYDEYVELVRKGGTVAELSKLETVTGAGPYPTTKSCGLLRIRFGTGDTWAGAHRIRQRLSLADGAVRFTLDKHMTHPRIESFVSRPDRVLAIRVTDVSHAECFHNKIELLPISDAAIAPPRLRAGHDLMTLDRTMPGGFRFVLAVKIVPTGGAAWKAWVEKNFRPQYRPVATKRVKAAVEWDRLVAPVGGDFDLYVAVVSSLESSDPLAAARKLVQAAARKGYRRIFAGHRHWWTAFWRKSFVKLSDPMLEQLWYYSLYQLASSYGEAPVPGLCGLWYGPDSSPVQMAPWCGTYTNDQNSEMVPMPLFSSNHPELAESFCETFNRMIPALKRYTRRLTGRDGIMLPLGLTPLARDPVIPSAFFGGSRIQCGGPFHGVIYAWTYAFTRDPRALRKYVYPFLREVCVFFAEYMTLDHATGRYRLWPSCVAEIPLLDVANPTSTLAFLKLCLRQAIAGARSLRVDAEWIAKWEDILARFPEYPQDHGILLDGEGIPWNHHVNQYGALYSVFPCGEFGAESDGRTKRLVRDTYESYATRYCMRSYADANGSHFFNGWTWFFDNMIALRMGWRKRVWEAFWNGPLRCHLKPNGLFTHNAFAIADPARSEANLKRIPNVKIGDMDEMMPLSEPMHGNSGSECTPNIEAKETVCPIFEMSSNYVTFMNETLLQSHRGLLRIFPCVPRGFTGGFDRLRAEGAFLVSAFMERGLPAFVLVRSLRGGAFRMRNPWRHGTVFCVVNGQRTAMPNSREFVIQTRRAQTFTFFTDARAWKRAVSRTFRAEWPVGPRSMPMKDGSVAWVGKKG
ncbi:MAG: glycoside hydrolase N-terminal domain-containing protein [Kiritimatiellae bacterium]|nr:glycoside hydrolase N-terminal domain-containing protein [Kiritimatiellia bacterium]